MGAGWQLIDLAVRTLKYARKTADLQKTPKVVAVVTATIDTMTSLLSHYTSGASGVPTGMTQDTGTDAEPESNPSPDAAGEPGTMDSTSE